MQTLPLCNADPGHFGDRVPQYLSTCVDVLDWVAKGNRTDNLIMDKGTQLLQLLR